MRFIGKANGDLRQYSPFPTDVVVRLWRKILLASIKLSTREIVNGLRMRGRFFHPSPKVVCSFANAGSRFCRDQVGHGEFLDKRVANAMVKLETNIMRFFQASVHNGRIHDALNDTGATTLSTRFARHPKILFHFLPFLCKEYSHELAGQDQRLMGDVVAVDQNQNSRHRPRNHIVHLFILSQGFARRHLVSKQRLRGGVERGEPHSSLPPWEYPLGRCYRRVLGPIFIDQGRQLFERSNTVRLRQPLHKPRILV